MASEESCFYKFQVFAALALATIIFSMSFDSYQDIGPELLANRNFADNLAHWQSFGENQTISLEEPGIIRITNDDPDMYAGLWQVITNPDRFRLLRLSGDIKTENIQPGQRGWHKARLVLSSHDGQGRWLPAPHHVVLLAGSKPWRRYSRVFEVIPQAEQLHVIAQIPRSIGTMWVKNLSLSEVRKKTNSVYFITAGIILWGLFISWLAIPRIISCHSLLLKMAAFLALFCLLLGTLSPGQQKLDFEKDSAITLHKMMAGHFDDNASSVETGKKNTPAISRGLTKALRIISKWGHFFLFALLAFFLAAALPTVKEQYLLIDLFMLAAATEFAQFFIPGRTPLVMDGLIDIAGTALGLGLIIFRRRLKISGLKLL